MIYIKSNFLTKSKHVFRLLCIATNFANIYEHCIVIIIEISISISSALESDSSFPISTCYKRYTDRNITTARNNIIHDYKFIVVLLMLYQVYMIIVLTLLFNKFRFEFNTKTNIIYHSQDTEHHMPLSMY